MRALIVVCDCVAYACLGIVIVQIGHALGWWA